jgi:hypothetical protein
MGNEKALGLGEDASCNKNEVSSDRVGVNRLSRVSPIIHHQQLPLALCEADRYRERQLTSAGDRR